MQPRAPLPSSPVWIPLAFVLALLASMLIAAVASPWVQAALAPVAVAPLHRVFTRLTMLGVIAISVWLSIRHGVANRALLGFSTPWPLFMRRAAIGLAAGLALMAMALLPLFLLHVRTWNERAPIDGAGWLILAAKGLGSGIAVALIEETFFRGALQGTLQRIGARRWALFAVPVLYAAVHFLGRAASVPYEEVDGFSGFVALRGFFAGYAQPLAIIDAFIALWCVGLLLALVRQRWQDLAGCIGMHAGFVATIAVFRKVSAPAPVNAWSFLVGDFDGLLGWWLALLTGVLALLVYRTRPDKIGRG